MKPLLPVPGSADEVIVSAVFGLEESFDLFRLNLATGGREFLTKSRPPGDAVSDWLMDRALVPRVALSRGKGASTELTIHYRKAADAPWQELARVDTTRAPAFVPLAFDIDNKHLFVASNHQRKNMAIFRYDPDAKEFVELVAQHDQYDLGASPDMTDERLDSLVFGGDDGRLVGIRLDGTVPQTVWLDPEYARIQASIDAALPNRFNVFQGVGKSKRFLVTSFSDTSPGRFLLFDSEKRALEDIGFSRPWLEGKLAQVRPFLLKTRDGLQIPSYYVLPRNHQPGVKLPTIVHIHGGPMARDVVQGGRFGPSFGVREAQVLASRGYAVVLPNFRVTPQLGSDIYYAGFGAYGKQMSDDHEDAVKWAIAQGFADPAKICISGASYGGYAALHAVSRTTNPFACAISGLPVTDRKFQRSEADYSRSPSAVEYWRKLQGVKDFDDPLVREMSPLFNAERIKVPVFMYIGDEDTRTPPAQARRMADALQKAGNPVKHFFVGKGEGHGYGVEANSVGLYEQMLKFLDEVFKR